MEESQTSFPAICCSFCCVVANCSSSSCENFSTKIVYFIPNRFLTYAVVRFHSVIDFRFPVVESIHFVLYHIPVLLHENVDLNKSNNRINQARKEHLLQANERTNTHTQIERIRKDQSKFILKSFNFLLMYRICTVNLEQGENDNGSDDHWTYLSTIGLNV